MATPAAILSILVTANTSKAKAELVGVQRQLGATEKSSHKMAKAAGVAGLAIGVGLAEAAKTGFAELQQGAKVTAQTNAVLKSTGGIAHVSAKGVDTLANSILRKTGIDDEAVKSGENMLLTFTKVRNETGRGNDIFNQATKSVADMATAMNNGAVPSGKKMAQTSILIGKALNDPIKGVTALRRVGVQLTESQQDQIKALVKNGETMKAQKIILRELNTEFGGSAAAAGKTLPGQLAILNESYQNLAGTVMEALLPALQKVVPKITAFVQQMQDGRGAGGEFVDGLRDVAGVLKPIVSFFAAHPKMAAVAVSGWIAYKTGALGAITSITGALTKAGAMSNPFTAILAVTATGLVASQQHITSWSDKTKEVFAQLRKDTNPAGIEAFAAKLEAAGAKGGPFADDMRKAAAGLRSMNKPALDVQNAIDKLAHGVPADMSTIATSVRLNMKLIKKEMGSKSAEAKEALSRNFNAGVDRIRDAMHAGTISTKEGLAKIRSYFVKDLALYGITGKQANRYLSGNDTLTGVSDTIVKAGGGFIGNRGEAGGDNVPIVVGRGEAILNRHQQKPVEHALRATYGMGLGDLFSQVSRPHYMAGGGFAGMVSKANQIDAQKYNYEWGGGHNSTFTPTHGSGHGSGPGIGFDCSGAVSAVLNAGGLLSAPRTSGGLMNYGKPGPGLVTIFANPTHTYMRLGNKYFGTTGSNPGGGAGWFAGAPRKGFVVRHADAAAATIKRVMFPGGMGALSGIGQAGLDQARGAANRALRKVAFGGYTGGGDPNNNFAGGGFVSTSYGPPWGGIQGTGVTATGVNLKNSPHTYGIAVDPSVLSLGHKYNVWPNPFGYRGAFKAFDTGGAIKGNRIDFYDWRGRTAQLGWGRRNVTVAAAGSKAGGRGKATGVAKVVKKKFGKSGKVTGSGGVLSDPRRPGSVIHMGDGVSSPPSWSFTDPVSADSGEDPNQGLIDAQNAAAEAAAALAEQIAGLRDEEKRRNDFADSVANVTSYQAIKALSDVISGQIVGVGYAGRSQTASSGSTVRY